MRKNELQNFKLEQSTEKNKVKKYGEMVDDAKAIFILSASARNKNFGEKKMYRADSYSSLDNHGSMGGGHARVIAAAEISQFFPKIKLVTTSYDYEDEPTLAETYAQELKRLGVSEKTIELEEKSTNTLTELLEMVKMARRNSWRSVAILTGEIHFPRVRSMLDHLEELAKRLKPDDKDFFESWDYFKKGKELQIRLLPAEEILISRDAKYEKIIEAMRNSDAYAKTVETEKQGVRQIEEGIYGKK
ncbi:MAG: YdcF family protein [bacterium]|nr:YdcF family protein [bacterium]